MTIYGDCFKPVYYYFEAHKLIYIQVEKCGSSSILECLQNLLPPQGRTGDKMNLHGNPHFTKIKKIKKKHLDGSHIIFAVIRDPLDRINSCYKQKYGPGSELEIRGKGIFDDYLFGYLKKNPGNLENFIKKIIRIPVCLMEPHFKPMYRRIMVKDIFNKVILLDLENLAHNFEPIRLKFGLPPLRHLNSTHADDGKGQKRLEISKETEEAFKKKYKIDFMLYAHLNSKLGNKVG